jgi:hypothetical protein
MDSYTYFHAHFTAHPYQYRSTHRHANVDTTTYDYLNAHASAYSYASHSRFYFNLDPDTYRHTSAHLYSNSPAYRNAHSRAASASDPNPLSDQISHPSIHSNARAAGPPPGARRT